MKRFKKENGEWWVHIGGGTYQDFRSWSRGPIALTLAFIGIVILSILQTISEH